jgi:hypothetical protein
MVLPLFLFFLAFGSYAQEERFISGKLLEKGTRKPLRDVSVFILPHKLRSVTSSGGEFRFDSIPEGDCTFIINLSGYEKFEKKIKCSPGNNIFYLEKKYYTTFETTVTAKANKRDDQTQSLTQEEFMKAPGSFGGDPVRAAQNLPGVAAAGASAQIIVQGASPDDTGYVINGHRVPLVFHFGGLSSVVIPEAVERVDLLPSGYGPEYSRAIGGIIGLTTKTPKDDRLHGMAYVDLFNTGALIEGPIDDKSSIFIGGRYSYIGQVLKKVAESNDDFDLTAAPTFYDFTSIYRRQLDDKNELKTTLIASKDELELILNRPAANDPGLRGDFYNRTEFFRLIPQLNTQINSTNRMENSLGIGQDNLLVNIGGRYLDINSFVISQRSEITTDWSSTYKSYIGLDNQWNFNEVGVNLPTRFSVGGVRTPFSVGDERKFFSKGRESQLGAYIRQEIKTTPDSPWTFLPNMRIDHFSTVSDTQIQPRLQLRYQWDKSLQFRSSIGKYAQAPQPQESAKNFGNPDITSPYAIHYTTGFTKDFRQGATDGLELTNNYFYKELKDLIFPDVRSRFENSGTGTIVGGELQAKYRKNEWSSQVVYTYLKSRRHIPGFGTRPSDFDQTHNLNIIGSYNLARWTFSGRFRFVTGLPFTPINGAVFDSDNDVYIPSPGAIYSERFESFRQLDIRIDRKFVFDTWILTAYLDIQNISNQRNSQNIEYSYDYTENKKVRGLPILPTFGIKGEF